MKKTVGRNEDEKLMNDIDALTILFLRALLSRPLQSKRPWLSSNDDTDSDKRSTSKNTQGCHHDLCSITSTFCTNFDLDSHFRHDFMPPPTSVIDDIT